MRCATAAGIKRGKRGAPCQSEPREGTRIRRLYDTFKAAPGTVIELKSDPANTLLIEPLRNFYGLDIRHIQKGSSRTGRPCLWLLAGEWFGRVYVDYVAERLGGDQ